MLTGKQAKALLLIVQEAKVRGWALPTASELAKFLYGANRRTNVRAAASIISRIQRAQGVFSKRGGKRGGGRWFVNPGRLITEPSTAACVLALADACQREPDRSISRQDFVHSIISSSGLLEPPSDYARVLSTFLGSAGYIEDRIPGKLRIGRLTYEQLPYLRLLADLALPSVVPESPGSQHLQKAISPRDSSLADTDVGPKQQEAPIDLRQREQRAVADYLGGLSSRAMGSLPLPPACDVTGYVVSRPYESPIGGDFCEVIGLNDTTVGILLGDGLGNGIRGALSMLPLVSAFRLTARDSTSTKHVLEKIRVAAREMRAQGTVLYFIVTKKNNKWYLLGSSAGHPQLLIIRKTGYSLFPREGWTNSSLGFLEGCQIGEDFAELQKGDVIVGYTDGIYDRLGLEQRTFETALLGELSSSLGAEPKQIASVVEEWALRQASGSFCDDATIVVLRVGDAT